MSTRDAFLAYQAKKEQGYKSDRVLVGDTTAFAPPKKKRATGVIVIVIIVIVLLAVALLVFFILRRRASSTTPTNGGGTTGGGTSGGTTTGCKFNADCSNPAAKVCNPSTGLCVGCLSNGDCTGSSPICQTSSNSCIQCVSDIDCGAPAVCSQNACCNNTAPNINSVLPITSSDSSVTVEYLSYQSGDPLAKVNVYILTSQLQQLGTSTIKPATGGSVTVYQSELNLPNTFLFPGVGYYIGISITYSCGADVDVSTSAIFAYFTMPACTLTPVTPLGFTVNGLNNPLYYSHPGIVINHSGGSNGLSLTSHIAASKFENTHPNLCEFYYPSVKSLDINPAAPGGTPCPCDQITLIPYGVDIGETLYIWIANVGSPNNCISGLRLELFKRTF